MGDKVSAKVELACVSCAACGVVFGVPDNLESRLRETHQQFYCPNGHINYYPQKTDAERLRSALDNSLAEVRELRHNLDGTLKTLAESKKELKRVNKRIHGGTCPECKRHFVNLERHMHTKHSKAI